MIDLRPLLALGLAAALGCASTSGAPATPPDSGRPYALVLGTAQDAGVPQVGCGCSRCAAAHSDPSARRLVTSLLLADPVAGRRYLFDASPDLIEQVALAAGHPGERVPKEVSGGRPPLFEGIFLTHAHMGHYSGLLQLGREAYGASAQKLYVSERMAGFLRDNDPWAQMLARGTFELIVLAPELPLELRPGLTVTALEVPHRDEYSDTLAFRIDTEERALLYLPDIDKWRVWSEDLGALLGELDYALVDGTFFADGEIPGRSMADIPHPFVAETMQLLSGLPAAERAKLVFTHLNHSNPLVDDRGPEAAAVRAAGFSIARRGQRFEL